MKLKSWLSAAAILPVFIACKSYDTPYKGDRSARTGSYSESERSSRDSQGRDTYARSDINRGVATVDLKTESGGRLNGTATILHNEGDSNDAKLIVHLENAEPGEYTVALGSTCDFSASGANAGATLGASAGANISQNDDEDTAAGARAGIALGESDDLGTLEVSEDGIGHFEKSLSDSKLSGTAAIIVKRSSDSDRLSEKSATEGRADLESEYLSACGLISMPTGAPGETYRGSFEAESESESYRSESGS